MYEIISSNGTSYLCEYCSTHIERPNFTLDNAISIARVRDRNVHCFGCDGSCSASGPSEHPFFQAVDLDTLTKLEQMFEACIANFVQAVNQIPDEIPTERSLETFFDVVELQSALLLTGVIIDGAIQHAPMIADFVPNLLRPEVTIILTSNPQLMGRYLNFMRSHDVTVYSDTIHPNTLGKEQQ